MRGSGKSFLTTGFGVSACRQFFNVKHIRLPELLDELSLAKLAADGSYLEEHKKIYENRPPSIKFIFLPNAHDISKFHINLISPNCYPPSGYQIPLNFLT